MERARGIRKWLQSMLFPDLVHLLDAHEDLEQRLHQLDKGVGVLDRSVKTLDERVDQVDKAMVQVDHGLNRLDKEMVRLSKGIDQLNKGMDQLNKDVDEREKDLTIRLGNLKAKLEADHARAMGEVAELLETHSFEVRNAEQGHSPAGAPLNDPELKDVEQTSPVVRNRALIQPDRARAISELSAALGPQAPVEEFKSDEEPEPDHARALDELAALLGSTRRREEPKRDERPRDPMRDEPDRFVKASNGQPPPLDFAAILEHIRNREVAM